MSIFDDFCDNAHNSFSAVPEDYLEAIKTSVYSHLVGCIGNMIKVSDSNGDFKVFLNQYTMIVGDSGRGKSPLCCKIVEVIEKVQKEINKKRLEEEKRAFSKIDDDIERNDKLTQSKKKEESKRLKDAYIPSYGLPAEDFYLISHNFTVAACFEDAALRYAGGIFLFKDEIMGLISHLLSEKTENKNDLEFFNEGYESQNSFYRLSRKMKDAKIPVVRDLCINLCGNMTTASYHKYLEKYNGNKEENGLYARFQNVYFFSVNEKKQLQDRKRFSDSVFNKMLQLVDFILKRRIEFIKSRKLCNDEHCEIVEYKTSAEQEDMLDMYIERIKKDYPYKSMKAYFNKHRTAVIKYAGFLHAINLGNKMFTQSSSSKQITDEEIIEAIEWGKKKVFYTYRLYREEKEESVADEQEQENFLDYLTNFKTGFNQAFACEGWSVGKHSRYRWKGLPKGRDGKINLQLLEEIIKVLERKEKIFSFVIDHKGKKYIRYSLHPNQAKDKQHMKILLDLFNKHYDKSIKKEEEELMTVELSNEQSQSLNEIKKNIDFVSTIKKHIPEWRKSNEAVKCIFHEEKTGSLYINSIKEKFYCFGCGEKGDILDFIRLTENKTLKEIINEYKDNKHNFSSSSINMSSAISENFDESGEKQIGIYERRNSNSQEAQQKHIEPSRFIEQQKIVRDILKRCSKDDKAISKYFSGRLKLNEFNDFLRKCGVEKTIFDNKFYNADDILFKKTLGLKIDGKNTYHSAIICKVKNSISDELLGIHRLYLNDNGDDLIVDNGKRVKRLLNLDNDMKGGTIKVLDGDNDYAILCEGIETAVGISFYRNFDTTYIPLEFKTASIYSGISSTHLRHVNLAEKNILIVADNGEAGEKAAQLAKEKLTKDNVNAKIKIFISNHGDALDDYIKLFNLGEK